MTETDQNLLGDKGEKYLDTICLNAGLRPIDPKPDIEGIDRRLAWITPGSSVLAQGDSYDTISGGRRINIQVKTTEKVDGVVSVKLSAIKHLVDMNEPAFLLMVQYSAGPTPILSLLHIAEKTIDRILKALRACQKKGKKPHKTFVTFRLSKGDVILAEDIKTYLETKIPEDMDAYAEQKIQYRKSTGYDEFRYVANLVIKADSTKSLTDALMGRTPLNIIEAQHFETRFDISLPCKSPFIDDVDVILNPQTLGRWTVTTTGTEDIAMEGEVTSNYAPGMPTDIAEAEWKTKFCKINITPGHFDFSLDVDELYHTANAPSEMLQSIQFMQNVLDGGVVSFNSKQIGPMFNMPATKLVNQRISFDVQYWTNVLKAVQHIWLKSGLDEYPIIINDLDADAVSSACFLLDPDFAGNTKPGLIEIGKTNTEQDELITKSNSVGYVVSINIGERRVAICSIFDATPKIVDETYQITTSKLNKSTARVLRTGKEELDFEDFYHDSVQNFQASFWVKSYSHTPDQDVPIQISNSRQTIA